MKALSGAAPLYEIYALKYAGPFTSKLAMLLWMEGWDQDAKRNYYIWAIKGKGEVVVVDTGCRVALANERKLSNFVNPLEMLARIDAHAGNVKKVIITHIHFDHAGGVEAFCKAFPNAVFYVQKKEYDFWIKNPLAGRRAFACASDSPANKALADLEGTDRLRLVNGDKKIMPGIEVLLAPGHTVGLQAVAVNTVRGTAIIASDCAHIKRNFRDDNPSALITDMVAWMESYDKLRSKAPFELLFPGHDEDLLTKYPHVAKDVTRLV